MDDNTQHVVGRRISFATDRRDGLTYTPIISPITIGVRVFIVALLVVLVITGFKIIPNISWGFYDPEFLKGILVEAHGMLFDLLVIGILTLWLNQRRDKQLQLQISVQRYMDEVIDFRNWRSEEASHRVAANLHRLAMAGYYITSLDGYYLQNANLADANLAQADLSNADLTGADLRSANLSQANLTNTILKDAKYDIHTKLPRGFDPAKAGMVLN